MLHMSIHFYYIKGTTIEIPENHLSYLDNFKSAVTESLNRYYAFFPTVVHP